MTDEKIAKLETRIQELELEAKYREFDLARANANVDVLEQMVSHTDFSRCAIKECDVIVENYDIDECPHGHCICLTCAEEIRNASSPFSLTCGDCKKSDERKLTGADLDKAQKAKTEQRSLKRARTDETEEE